MPVAKIHTFAKDTVVDGAELVVCKKAMMYCKKSSELHL